MEAPATSDSAKPYHPPLDTVAVSFFDEKSKAQFLSGSREYLGNSRRVKSCPAGTIVLLNDLTKREMWGVCMIENWPGTSSPCREHHLLDCETYSHEFAKYNKYEIRITNFRVLKNPIAFEQVRAIVGGDERAKGSGNMWKGFHSSFSMPFQEGADKYVLERYYLWARSLL